MIARAFRGIFFFFFSKKRGRTAKIIRNETQGIGYFFWLTFAGTVNGMSLDMQNFPEEAEVTVSH